MLPRVPHAIPGRVIAAAAALITVGLCLTPGPAAASAPTVTGHLLFSSSGASGAGLLTGGAAVTARRAASPSYSVFAGMDLPNQVTRGPDGAYWFTNVGSNSIGRFNASGTLSDFTAPGINTPGGDHGRPGRRPVVHQ